MSQDHKIPKQIKNAVDELVNKYSESKPNTKAGSVLRFIARFVSTDLLLKLIAHKSKNK